MERKNKAEHLARYEFVIPLVKNKKVLDIACGTGYGSQILAERGASSVVGGDIDQATVATAEREKRAKNLRFAVMDGLAILASEGEFEAVVSLETIEHIQEAERFVTEIARVLVAGGQLILSTPNREATAKLKINNPFHVRELNQQELIEILEKKFEILKIYGQRPLAQMTNKQKFLRKAYFLYTKIKWLEFLKRWFSTKTRQAIGKEIDGLADSCAVEEIKPGREYLYFVVVARKR